MFAWVNNFLEETCSFEVFVVINMSIQKPSQMYANLSVQFFLTTVHFKAQELKLSFGLTIQL